MVRGSTGQKIQLVNNNVFLKKSKKIKAFRPSLSHSNRNNSQLKCSSLSSHDLNSTLTKINISTSLDKNSILKYYGVQKNEILSTNSLLLVPTTNNSNEKPENVVEENYSFNHSKESNESFDAHLIQDNCSTESCVPFSPTTALSRLNLDGPKKISKVKKCLIPQEDVLKLNNQKLNAKVLKDSRNSTNSQTKLTEFFPVRRSVRKTEKTVLEEKRKTLEEAVLSNREDGLEVRIFEGKGRGIMSTRKFYKGEFVVEYAGELISMEEAQKREAIYSRNENVGCYMYYFKHRNQQHCIDATAETKRLGRLLNHSRYGNLCTKTVEIKGAPRLILVAKEDIEPDCELTYDYGDRSKLSLQYHPWLAH